MTPGLAHTHHFPQCFSSIQSMDPHTRSADLCQRSQRLRFEAKHLGDHFHSQSVSPSFGISCGPLVNCSQLWASQDGKQAMADTWLQALECSFAISPSETQFVEFKPQLFAWVQSWGETEFFFLLHFIYEWEHTDREPSKVTPFVLSISL